MAARIHRLIFSLGLDLVLTLSLAASTSAAAWLNDAPGYSQARWQHTSLGKPLVIYFYVDWCPYCRGLETEILNTSRVEAYLSALPRVKINPEHGPNEEALAKQFDVHGYPRFLIIPAPGATPRHISGWRQSGDQWVRADPADFIAQCRAAVESTSAAVARSSATQRVEEVTRLPAGQPGIQEVVKDSKYYREVGQSYYQAGRKTAALEALEKSVELGPGDAAALEWSAYVCIDLGRYQRAVGYLNRLIQLSPNYRKGRAYYLRGHAYAELGYSAKAKTDAQKACNMGDAEGCALARAL